MKASLLLLLALVAITSCQSTRKNSKFVWARPKYPMPWLRGPNVCAVEEVYGTRKRFYQECMAYLPRKICGKQTFIRYHCCTGYEKSENGEKGCTGVKPMQNVLDTAKGLYLRDFRKYLDQSGSTPLIRNSPDVLTVFAPHNKAFNGIDPQTKYQLGDQDPNYNILGLHMTKGRYGLSDFYNDQTLESLMPDADHPEPGKKMLIHINKYGNGITTANCARIMLPDQTATDGILHVTEKVVTPVEDRGTIPDYLAEAGSFNQLLIALSQSGLMNELRSPGHFTLVAPTDDAFAAMDPDTLARISNDKELLKKLIQYHVLDTTYCSAAILGPTSLQTKLGQKLNFSCDVDDSISINGVKARETDLLATNGVIQVVDEVLLPEAVKSAEDVLEDLEMYSFLEYAENAGLETILKGSAEGNFTIFVPNEDAFNSLTTDQKRILQTQTDASKTVFNYHVVPGKISTKDFRGEIGMETTSDITAKLHVNVYQKGFGINNAKIISSDHEINNGYIHIIDKVIFPPDQSIYEKVTTNVELRTFRKLLERSGELGETLMSMEGNMTLFAPTDDAFDQLESSITDKLMVDAVARQKFLQYHLLEKPIYSSGIKPELHYRFRTMAKEWIKVEQSEELDPIRVNENSVVLLEDVETTNGVMHVIDTVLECPCMDEFN